MANNNLVWEQNSSDLIDVLALPKKKGDEAQKLEIKVTLDGDKLNLLRDRLKITEN